MRFSQVVVQNMEYIQKMNKFIQDDTCDLRYSPVEEAAKHLKDINNGKVMFDTISATYKLPIIICALKYKKS